MPALNRSEKRTAYLTELSGLESVARVGAHYPNTWRSHSNVRHLSKMTPRLNMTRNKGVTTNFKCSVHFRSTRKA